METMRFLLTSTFYPPHFVGGDAIHVKLLADLLTEEGHEVTVVCSGDAALWKGVFREEEKVIGKEKVEMISSKFPTLQVAKTYLTNRSQRVANILDRVNRELKPDVVHHHNISLFGWYPIRGRWRTVYTAHDYWAICQRNDLLKYGTRLCETPNCLSCCALSKRPPQLWRKWNGAAGPEFSPDIILAPSRFMMLQLQDRLESFQGQFAHCPNFVPDPGSLHRERTDRLLYAGILGSHKGISALVRAAISESSIRLEVVGQGPQREHLSAMIRENGAEDRVRIRGRVSRDVLLDLYRSVRALIIPSVWPENAPLVALEALSAGTPVLASKRGGLPELLDPIDSRLCKEPSELLGELGNLDWVNELGGICREEWEKSYSPSAFRRRYFQILERDVAC